MHPAFDKRHTSPPQNYGIHGVDVVYYLEGKRGKIYFAIFTNWQLNTWRKKLNVNRTIVI